MWLHSCIYLEHLVDLGCYERQTKSLFNSMAVRCMVPSIRIICQQQVAHDASGVHQSVGADTSGCAYIKPCGPNGSSPFDTTSNSLALGKQGSLQNATHSGVE